MLKRMARDNPDLARDLTGVAASLKRPETGTTATSSGEPAKATAKATATAATPEPEPAPAAVAPQAPQTK